MKLKPLFDRVIAVDDQEKTSKGGILLGAESSNSVRRGKVLFVGDGNEKEDGKLTKMLVREGDKILFNKFTAGEANLDGQLVYILRQTDILAIIE